MGLKGISSAILIGKMMIIHWNWGFFKKISCSAPLATLPTAPQVVPRHAFLAETAAAWVGLEWFQQEKGWFYKQQIWIWWYIEAQIGFSFIRLILVSKRWFDHQNQEKEELLRNSWSFESVNVIFSTMIFPDCFDTQHAKNRCLGIVLFCRPFHLSPQEDHGKKQQNPSIKDIKSKPQLFWLGVSTNRLEHRNICETTLAAAKISLRPLLWSRANLRCNADCSVRNASIMEGFSMLRCWRDESNPKYTDPKNNYSSKWMFIPQTQVF